MIERGNRNQVIRERNKVIERGKRNEVIEREEKETK